MSKEEAPVILSLPGRDPSGEGVSTHEVAVTHPSKPYFTKQVRLTKLDVVQYYVAVAEGALTGIRDRPIVLKRFVNGAEAEPFYQKRAPDKRPPFLRTVTLSFPSGRTAEEIVVDVMRADGLFEMTVPTDLQRGSAQIRYHDATTDLDATLVDVPYCQDFSYCI